MEPTPGDVIDPCETCPCPADCRAWGPACSEPEPTVAWDDPDDEDDDSC